MSSTNNPLKDYIQNTYKLPSERNQEMNKVTSLLEQLNKTVERIEARQNAQDARIAMLENAMNIKSVPDTPGTSRCNTATLQKQGARYKDDQLSLLSADAREEGNDRKKPTRAESFQYRSKSPRRSRRFPHTVPSDKDKEAMVSSHRRQCLSNAIRSNIVEMVQFGNYKNGTESWLPLWLTPRERKDILENTPIDPETQMRKFLLLLKDQDFETMRLWLQNDSRLDPRTLKDIWKTYEEFNDTDISFRQARCFFCKLITSFDVKKGIDYFYSAFIVDTETCIKATNCDSPTGKQTSLWESVAEQCKRHPVPDVVIKALLIALQDAAAEATDTDEHTYMDLIEDIYSGTIGMPDIMRCECEKSCSRLLYPVSLVKGCSLASMYLSPPPRRRERHDSSSVISSSSASDSPISSPPLSLPTEDSTSHLATDKNMHSTDNQLLSSGDYNLTSKHKEIVNTKLALEIVPDSRQSHRHNRQRRRKERHARDDITQMKLLKEPTMKSTKHVTILKEQYDSHKSSPASSDYSPTNSHTYENLPMCRGDNYSTTHIQRHDEGSGARMPSHVVYGKHIYIQSKHIKMHNCDRRHKTSGTQSESPEQ